MRLEVQNISKQYGSVRALDDVSISLESGEIHAIVGENGAGKSTLVSIISGFVRPDSGKVSLEGSEIPYGDAAGCRKLGIELVHQHFMLVPAFSVEENLILSGVQKLPANLDRALAQPAMKIANELGWDIDLKKRTGDLPVGIKQKIEILKVLSTDSPVVLFDEPTAVLSHSEIEDLFAVLKRLKDQGKIVVLIAHKLSEVLAVADRITVLRGGKHVATELRGGVDADQLAKWIVGELPAETTAAVGQVGQVRLKVSGLHILGDRGESAVRGVDFEVSEGEIFGIGGVDGNGQVELAEALAGIRDFESGSLSWGDRGASHRIAYIPQDRQTDGLVLEMSILDNLLITGYARKELRSGPFLSSKKIMPWAESIVEHFDIRVGTVSDSASSLSGGNQQKVVLSRSLDVTPDLLIAVNPTRGLDFRSTQFVHEKLMEAKADGAAIVLFSTDLDELFALSTRTAFMSRGQLMKESDAAAFLGGKE